MLKIYKLWTGILFQGVAYGTSTDLPMEDGNAKWVGFRLIVDLNHTNNLGNKI